MNRKTIFITLSLTLLLILGITTTLAQEPLDTAFSYQGRLDDGGSPASGSYEFEFKLFDAATAGNQVGSMVNQTVDVTNGLFLLDLDFGSDAFNGQNRYLEVGVRPAGSSDPYSIFAERQKLTATPYALYASRAPWSGLLGIPTEFADGLDDDTLAGLNCLNGQVAKWDGVAWLCADDLAEPGGPHTHHTLAAADGDPLEAVFVDEAGKVGIGTTTPSHNLEVIGNEADVASLRASNAANGIDLIVGGTSNTDDDGVITSDPRYTGSDLRFLTNDAFVFELDEDQSGEDADFMVLDKDQNVIFDIDEGGNIGINTEAPGARLDIISPSDGNTNVPALRVSNTRIYGYDLILGGTDNSVGGDDGIITSDPRFLGSDIVLRSQDAVFVVLDKDRNEIGQFEIQEGNGKVLFNVSEHNDPEIGANVQIRGELTIDDKKPIQFERFTLIGDNVHKPTGYMIEDYYCGIAGLHTGNGDIQEDDTGVILAAHTFVLNNEWHIRADFRTHNTHENWTITIMCVDTNIAEWHGSKQ